MPNSVICLVILLVKPNPAVLNQFYNSLIRMMFFRPGCRVGAVSLLIANANNTVDRYPVTVVPSYYVTPSMTTHK